MTSQPSYHTLYMRTYYKDPAHPERLVRLRAKRRNDLRLMREDPATRAKAQARVRRHRAKNREVARHYDVARRARKAGNGGSHTVRDWLDKCELLGNVCFYCGEAKPLTVDHNVPLSRGGSDAITNILPACRSCNCRKGARTATEFIATRRDS